MSVINTLDGNSATSITKRIIRSELQPINHHSREKAPSPRINYHVSRGTLDVNQHLGNNALDMQRRDVQMMHIPHRANHSGSVSKNKSSLQFGQRIDKGKAIEIIGRFVRAKASDDGPLSRRGCSEGEDSRTA